MSIHRTETGDWRVRWRDESGRNRSKVLGRKRDAEAFDAEVRRRKRTGELAGLDSGTETLAEFAQEWWLVHAEPNLAPRTRDVYASLWDTHCLPRMGDIRLRDLSPESCQRFAADLAAAGVGPASRRKALALLGGIVQRAVEWGRIPVNPVRTVRLPSGRPACEVRPLGPAVIEAMRAALGPRDACLVSVLAYAGLRPQEALAVRWRDVGERTLTIFASKTGRRRSVRLLGPLGQDLREWRLASGRPSADALVFPGHDGRLWSQAAYKSWSRKAPRGRKSNGRRAGAAGPFARAAQSAGVPDATPYTLRHSFCSLLLHEGRSVIYVARQLGHGAQLTLETYGHVIDELDDAPRLEAEVAIRRARSLHVPSEAVGE
jgi:integrase